MAHLGVHHRKIAQLWPQINGMVERFMGNINYAVQQAKLVQIFVEQALCQVFRHNSCPSELVLGRASRTHLPHWNPRFHQNTVTLSYVTKRKMKRQADAQHHATTSGLKLADLVLLHQRQTHKSDSPFSSQHLKITNIKGSMITAAAGSYSTTRNSSHFREFITSDEDEGEARPSDEQTSLSEDTQEPIKAALPNSEGPLQAEDTQEEKDHEKERSRPTRVSKKPKRLIEEL
ncbi:hypothetical protein NDU88_001844 [Pleurodeles waltl]|uniref:Uncharacterized protein n=1 Tax=Pleurodeles waltl TaxID=8319 RepID=A0AAV7TJI2_PLEWA|nr:hypothetical protein NDU88_001844 [Pleurodeles waltl]